MGPAGLRAAGAPVVFQGCTQAACGTHTRKQQAQQAALCVGRRARPRPALPGLAAGPDRPKRAHSGGAWAKCLVALRCMWRRAGYMHASWIPNAQ